MEAVWFILTFFVGLAVGPFLVIQLLIIVIFGIPFSLRLRSRGVLKDLKPFAHYLASLVLLSSLLLAVAYGLHRWLPDHVLGFWVGVGLVTFIGIGSCGANEANMGDYLESNAASIDLQKLSPAERLVVSELEKRN